MSDPGPPALALRDITHTFGATQALAGASLVVRSGTVHAVLGENGAGKTTLMRCAFGLVKPDRGAMEREGSAYSPRSPRDALHAGIGMVHQHFALVPAMTVAENVALGGQGVFSHTRTAAAVRELSERTGLHVDPGALVADLPLAARQRVEILKALSRNARLLILDEPSAMLTPGEAAELWRWTRSFVANGGTVTLVTHKLREALAIADDVTVLRRGATTLAAPATYTDEGELVRAMIGTAAHDSAVRVAVGEDTSTMEDRPRPAGRVVIAAESLELRGADGAIAIRDASFVIHSGEIAGVAAVEGAGHRELLRALGGRLQPARGVLRLPPSAGYVPEDRARDALVLSFSLVENVALAGSGCARGRTPWRALERRTEELLTGYDVRAADVSVAARTLSGGNQQKLVLAREFEAAAMGSAVGDRAVVLDNPTRGLDVVAASSVYRRLRDARDAGVAVVVYSTDLDEVIALADRVLVVHAGAVRELPADREAVGRAMVGL